MKNQNQTILPLHVTWVGVGCTLKVLLPKDLLPKLVFSSEITRLEQVHWFGPLYKAGVRHTRPGAPAEVSLHFTGLLQVSCCFSSGVSAVYKGK